jgi:oligopeptide transport system ATP-binding protein
VTHLLEIDDLKVEFASAQGVVKAVDGISYGVDAGETVPWSANPAAASR